MPADPTRMIGLTRRALLTSAGMAALLPRAVLAQPPAGPRIVTLDYGVASTLLSLGIPPIGLSDRADWKRWVVEPALPASVVDIGSSFEVNFEILLELEPDLIVTTPFLDELLPRLQSITKVIQLEVFSPEAGPVLPAASRATRELAIAIDRQQEGEALIAGADAFFRQCRDRLSAKHIPPVALVTLMDARHARIYSNPGLFDNVLERLGLRNAWENPSNYWGCETIGIEDLSKVADPDARVIVFEPVPPDALSTIGGSPLWQRLPFARPGHLSILPPVLMFGMLNEAVRFARLVTELLEKDI